MAKAKQSKEPPSERGLMIDTVIFDIGNVLIDFDWDGYMNSLFKDDIIIEKVNAAIWEDGRWAEFDRGVLSDQEIISRMVAHGEGVESEIRQTIDRVGECVRQKETTLPWIRSLHAAGLQVLYLSNYSEMLMQKGPEALSFLPEMDGGVFSCHVKVLKPDPAIYQAICEKYHLLPERCVFLDDLPENVDGAVRYGMQGIRFRGYEEAKALLDRMIMEG